MPFLLNFATNIHKKHPPFRDSSPTQAWVPTILFDYCFGRPRSGKKNHMEDTAKLEYQLNDKSQRLDIRCPHRDLDHNDLLVLFFLTTRIYTNKTPDIHVRPKEVRIFLNRTNWTNKQILESLERLVSCRITLEKKNDNGTWTKRIDHKGFGQISTIEKTRGNTIRKLTFVAEPWLFHTMTKKENPPIAPIPQEMFDDRNSASEIMIQGLLYNQTYRIESREGNSGFLLLKTIRAKGGWKSNHGLRKMLQKILAVVKAKGHWYGFCIKLRRSKKCRPNQSPDLIEFHRVYEPVEKRNTWICTWQIPTNMGSRLLEGLPHLNLKDLNKSFLECNYRTKRYIHFPDLAFGAYLKAYLWYHRKNLSDPLRNHWRNADLWWTGLTREKRMVMAHHVHSILPELKIGKKIRKNKRRKRDLLCLIMIAYTYRSLMDYLMAMATRLAWRAEVILYRLWQLISVTPCNLIGHQREPLTLLNPKSERARDGPD